MFFFQLSSVDVCQGMVGVSDQHGNIAVVRQAGIVWRSKSAGHAGWMVELDDTGVYHGHSAGVTKYSLLHGHQIWNTAINNKVLSGTQVNYHIYSYIHICIVSDLGYAIVLCMSFCKSE